MKSILSRCSLMLFILLLAPLFGVAPAVGEARAYYDAIAVGEPAVALCMSASEPLASAPQWGECWEAIRDAWEACSEGGEGDCAAALWLLAVHCGPIAACIINCILENSDWQSVVQCVVLDCVLT